MGAATGPLGQIVGSAFLAAGLLMAPSARAAPVLYKAHLTGPAEVPANASPGVGDGLISLDTATHTLSVDVSFSNLLGLTAASHIHCCTTTPGAGTAGVATQVPTFASFPLNVSAGTYSHVFDTSLAATYNPAFITATGGTAALAEANLAAGLAAGEAYLNIHTNLFASGEIRGFLTPAAVPEPATLGLFSAALVGLGLVRRRRRATP